MVPGQDPDLRAPALRAVRLWEVSIQLQPQTAGSRKSSSFLVRRMCSKFPLWAWIEIANCCQTCLPHRVFRIKTAPRRVESSKPGCVHFVARKLYGPKKSCINVIPDAPPPSYPFVGCSRALRVPSTSKSQWARRLSTGRKWWRWSRKRESRGRCLQLFFLAAWLYRARFRYAVSCLKAFLASDMSSCPYRKYLALHEMKLAIWLCRCSPAV